MSFEVRQKARLSLLDVLVTAFRAIAIAYLALHGAVTWFAYQVAGLAEALLTLVLLGVGDLYWTVTWWEAGPNGAAIVALAASVLCFVSWLGRPLFNRWVARFTRDMLDDATGAIERMTADRRDDADDPPDGTNGRQT